MSAPTTEELDKIIAKLIAPNRVVGGKGWTFDDKGVARISYVVALKSYGEFLIEAELTEYDSVTDKVVRLAFMFVNEVRAALE